MKYCQFCGAKIEKSAKFCTKCGRALDGGAVRGKATEENDAPNTGFAILGFFLPIIGIILYVVYSSTAPKKAKSALKGAIAGFIVSAILGVISSLISAAMTELFLDSLIWAGLKF